VTLQALCEVAKRLIRDAEEATEIIALALLFVCGNYFRIIIARVNQTRDPLEILLRVIFFGGWMGITGSKTHDVISSVTALGTVAALGPVNVESPKPAIPHMQ
jgi:hypothetical protein